MDFGPQTEEAAAHAIMDSAQESGINFFDTANVYGATAHGGWTCRPQCRCGRARLSRGCHSHFQTAGPQTVIGALAYHLTQEQQRVHQSRYADNLIPQAA